MTRNAARQNAVRPQPVSKSVLRKLDALEQDWGGGSEHAMSPAGTGHSRWMIPYADMITLLLALFMVLYALASLDQKSLARQVETLQQKLVAIEKPLDGADTPPVAMMAQAETDNARLQAQLEALLSKRPELAQGLKIHEDTAGVVVSVTDDILFAPGSAQLSPAAKAKLDTIAQALKQANRPIRVEGHTDNTPIKTAQFPSNWELSTARAINIIQYLSLGHHFKPEEMSAAGYGEYHPVADNSSIEGKRKNRRVDIVLLESKAPR